MTEILDTQDPTERKRIILLLMIGVPMEISEDKTKWELPIGEWLGSLQEKPHKQYIYKYWRIKPQ